MKKYTYISLFVGISIFASTLSTWAMPIGGNNIPSDYLVKGKDLSSLSMGIYGGQFKRDIKWDNSGITQTLKSNRILGYIGVDLFDWITLFAVGGSSESKIGDSETASSEGEYGAGFRLNLLSHFIAEPVVTEDMIRLNFTTRYLHSSSEIGFNDLSWDEISASLTMELVNHTTGNKFFTPESITLYAGPMYSTFLSDDFSESDDFGLMGGIEFFLVDTIVLDIEIQHIGETSASVGLNFHF